MQALLEALDENRIVLVASNTSKAAGLKKARRLGISTLVLGRTSDQKLDWESLHQKLIEYGVTRLFLAGFMRLVPEAFIRNWENCILNVHPSLLPQFPGLHAIEKSFEEKANMGVTVHVVIPEMDAGPVILQKKAVDAVYLEQESLTLEQAQLLIAKTEHQLVREAVRRFN